MKSPAAHACVVVTRPWRVYRYESDERTDTFPIAPTQPTPPRATTLHITRSKSFINALSAKEQSRQHRLYDGAEIAEPGARLRRAALSSSAPHHNAKTVTSLRVQHPGAATVLLASYTEDEFGFVGLCDN